MGETCGVTSIAAPAETPVVRAPAAMSTRLRGRLVLAVLAGLLLDVAFPPHDLWWVAPVPVAVLTLVCRGRSWRHGALLGLAAGLGFFVPLLVWTGTIAGALAWIALALLETAFFVPLGAALAV
jgi:apolipoprotein N-acyltransferase